MEITVKEMIEHLQTLPQDAVCITTNSNTMEQRGDELATLPRYSSEGDVSKVNTHDAFDGTPYSYDCYSTQGGNLKVVKF